MSFESGSITFRMYYLSRKFPTDYVEQFARRAAPPITTLGDTPLRGWVTGRHLLDTNINRDTAFYAGYLRLAMLKAERKIPASLLKAECRMEELVRMQAENRAELDRKTRTEIRKEIEARLLPTMPPQLKGMAMVHLPDSDVIFSEATSDVQMEALEASFREALGFGVIPVSPQYAAARRLKYDIRDYTPTSFSPDCDDESVGNSPGQDFLTWLWFYSEARGGMMKLPSGGDFAIMIEGPLTFVMEGQGAHEIVLRRGSPAISTEAKIALISGKKLRKAKLLLARGQDTWTVSLDAESFTFRSLKLPEGEKLEPISRFQERMTSMTTFTTAFLEIFDRFMKERTDEKVWKKTSAEIHRWVSERTAKK
ncbi:MAG: recombination-associated protein RdgC [bacterium]